MGTSAASREADEGECANPACHSQKSQEGQCCRPHGTTSSWDPADSMAPSWAELHPCPPPWPPTLPTSGLAEGRMSPLFLAAYPEWLPVMTGTVASPCTSPEAGRPQATLPQELGLNITSPVHLMWFPLLKKGPFSQCGLPLKHSVPSTRRRLHAVTLRSQAHSTGILASGPNTTVLRAEPQHLPASWAALGKCPASPVLISSSAKWGW